MFKMKSLTRLSIKNVSYVLLCFSMLVFVYVFNENYLTFGDISVIITTGRHGLHLVQPPKIGTKYVLSWHWYYLAFNQSRSIFPDLHCSVNNCVFSYKRNLINDDYKYYDAILFNDYDLESKDKPRRRSPSQLYIFTTFESAYKHSACESYNDDFFNWTFTYRLDSTVLWNYFLVQNFSGAIIAPSKEPHWQSNTDPIRPEIKAILKGKKLAAAWLVSHCSAESKRDEFIKVLHGHLKSFSLRIDAYGICSGDQCPNDDCETMLKNDYFFYLAFENSFSKDYVSEKVLHGYNNYAVPIVYGGANYSKFLPPGSYINAQEMHPYRLAVAIRDAIRYPRILEKYFKWTNQYTITDDPTSYHPLCDLCAALSKDIRPAPAIKNFRAWWNDVHGMSRCFMKPFKNKTVINYDVKLLWICMLFVTIFSNKLS